MPSWPELRSALDAFVEERDWDQYHDPKDLAASVSIEAAELLEVFQWRDPDRERVAPGGDLHEAVADEVADVLLYAFHLCRQLDRDPLELAAEKLERNQHRHPPGSHPEP